jgi:hypothetical protein
MRANLLWLSDEQWRRQIEPHQPKFLAKAILKRMRLTTWRISKEPPEPPHSTPGE